METRADGASPDPEAGSEQAAGGKRSSVDAVKKWLGLGAAILSFGSAVYGVLQYEAAKKAGAQAVADLLTTSRTEQTAGDYPQAWDSLQAATKAIDSDGLLVKLFNGLSAEQEQVHTAQQDLAMTWLRHAADQLQQGHTLSEVSDKVLPVLSTGADKATGARKADLLAHIGLAYYLKAQDGTAGLHPVSFYREAVALDPTNPYANTFWGDLLVPEAHDSAADLAQLKKCFAAALASGRARGSLRQWIHQMELGPMDRWLNYSNMAAVWWQAIDDMQKAGEPFDGRTLVDLRSEYITAQINVDTFRTHLDQLVAYVPINDHVELVRMLLKTIEPDERQYLKVLLAVVLEKAGKPQEALAEWRDAKATDLSKDDVFLAKQVDAEIRRLSTATKHS